MMVDSLNGLPTTVIWEENFIQNAFQTFIDFEINEPLIKEELFFVVEQTNAIPLSFGGDSNSNFTAGIHFVSENGNWTLIENSNFGQVTHR